MKKTLLFLFGALLLSFLTATPVSQANILLTAEAWLEQMSTIDYSVNYFEVVSDSLGIPCLYKVNFNPSGFVVIAADDRCYPILGYGVTGSISNDNPALIDLIGQYKRAISNIVEENLSNEQTQETWSSISENLTSTRNPHTISSLAPEWNQDSPYNDLCPSFDNQRSKVGCVATAFAQIVNYYKKWKYEFSDEDDYYSIYNPQNSSDLYYAWIDDYSTECCFPTFPQLNSDMVSVRNKFTLNNELTNTDKAALCFASGILLHMQYHPVASGAETLVDGSRAYGSLDYEFDTASKSGHTDNYWNQLLTSSLDLNRPVQYAAGHHSFIVYGYDITDEGYFYNINWGWNQTQSTNWWKLNHFNPTYDSETQNLNSSVKMIYNIRPIAHVNQIVRLCNNTSPGILIMALTKTNSTYPEDSEFFYSNIEGLFDFNTELGTYDVIISRYSGNYLPYSQNNVSFDVGQNFVQPSPIILYNGVIEGQVALSNQNLSTASVAIELLNNYGSLIATRQPDNSGYFQVNVSNGQYKVRYKVISSTNNIVYYAYTTETLTINQGSQSINLPLVTLSPITLTQLMVKPNGIGDSFQTIGEAIQYAQTTASSSTYSGNPITINVYAGEYDWPEISYGENGFNFSYNNAQQDSINIKIRKYGNGNVTVKPNSTSQVNVMITNTNLAFEGIHFNQSIFYDDRCIYNMQGAGHSSFLFYNCIFGDTGTESQYRKLRFSDTSNIKFSGCYFQRCSATVEYGQLPSTWTTNCGILEFESCNNIDISYCNFTPYNSAVKSVVYASNVNGLKIRNSNLFINQFGANNCETGAVFVTQGQNITLNDNKFIGNVSYGGNATAINLTESIDFVITGNLFTANDVNQVGLTQNMSEILFKNCSLKNTDVFSRNIFDDQNSGNNDPVRFINIDSSIESYLNINNCDFLVHNVSGKRILSVYPFAENNPNSVTLNNCVFSTENVNDNVEFDCAASNQITVAKSIFDSSYDGSIVAFNNQYNTNPLLDGDYIPYWSDGIKSPCIDKGNLNSDSIHPWYETNINYDTDNSRLDIGAKPFVAEKHRNGLIALEKSEQWNWISIPAIDYPDNADSTDHEYYAFHTYEDNGLFESSQTGRILDDIRWLYNDDSGRTWWDDGFFVFPADVHHVKSQYGYKVKLNDGVNVPQIKRIEYSGFLPGCDGNDIDYLEIQPPDQTPENLNPLTNTYERETWLGYYLEESLAPQDALAPILNNIVSIKAQDWSMNRVIVNGQYTDDWEGRAPSCGIAINYGEMVAVRYIGTETVQFQWGNTLPLPEGLPQYERPEPEHFTFNKEDDYLPIYATIDLSSYVPGSGPTEIAVYKDNVCIGAEKISGEELQLKAYLEGEYNYDEEVFEFKFHFPSKSGNDEVVENFAVLNPLTSRYEVRNSIPFYCKNYMKVSLKPLDIADAQIPAMTRLENNYPNPFNPETTIRFDLAKSGKMKLEIFNVKGQAVKTLLNGDIEAGYHSIKWNGKDDNGKQTTSGVYFYRLTADGKSLTNKMLMLK